MGPSLQTRKQRMVIFELKTCHFVTIKGVKKKKEKKRKRCEESESSAIAYINLVQDWSSSSE
jgi:hypothetical protein